MDERKQQLAELLMAYVDGEVTSTERAEVERLLEVNPSARALMEQFTGVSDSLQGLPTYTLEATFSEDVLAQVARTQVAGRIQPAANQVDEEAADHEDVSPMVSLPLTTRPEAERSGRRWVMWASAAAAAVVVAAIWMPSDRAPNSVALHDGDVEMEASWEGEATTDTNSDVAALPATAPSAPPAPTAAAAPPVLKRQSHKLAPSDRLAQSADKANDDDADFDVEDELNARLAEITEVEELENHPALQKFEKRRQAAKQQTPGEQVQRALQRGANLRQSNNNRTPDNAPPPVPTAIGRPNNADANNLAGKDAPLSQEAQQARKMPADQDRGLLDKRGLDAAKDLAHQGAAYRRSAEQMVQLEQLLVDAGEEDVLVVHVDVPPQAVLSGALAQVLARQQINFSVDSMDGELVADRGVALAARRATERETTGAPGAKPAKGQQQANRPRPDKPGARSETVAGLTDAKNANAERSETVVDGVLVQASVGQLEAVLAELTRQPESFKLNLQQTTLAQLETATHERLKKQSAELDEAERLRDRANGSNLRLAKGEGGAKAVELDGLPQQPGQQPQRPAELASAVPVQVTDQLKRLDGGAVRGGAGGGFAAANGAAKSPPEPKAFGSADAIADAQSGRGNRFSNTPETRVAAGDGQAAQGNATAAPTNKPTLLLSGLETRDGDPLEEAKKADGAKRQPKQIALQPAFKQPREEVNEKAKELIETDTAPEVRRVLFLIRIVPPSE